MMREQFEYVSEHDWNMAPRKSVQQRRCGLIALILFVVTLLVLFASCGSSPETW